MSGSSSSTREAADESQQPATDGRIVRGGTFCKLKRCSKVEARDFQILLVGVKGPRRGKMKNFGRAGEDEIKQMNIFYVLF